MGAPGIAERLLALEAGVAALTAELQVNLRQIVGDGTPAPSPEPTALEQLAQQVGNSRLVAVLVRAGYTSVEAVAAAPDAALLAVDGVGEKALAAIRARLA